MSTLIQELLTISEARHHAMDAEKLFWRFVDAAEWNKDHDYDRIQGMVENLGKTTAVELYKVYQEKSNILYKELWDVTGVSDDGFSDLVAHIIGSGKEVYDAARADLSVAQKIIDDTRSSNYTKGYKEGFQYSWHVIYDKGWA